MPNGKRMRFLSEQSQWSDTGFRVVCTFSEHRGAHNRRLAYHHAGHAVDRFDVMTLHVSETVTLRRRPVGNGLFVSSESFRVEVVASGSLTMYTEGHRHRRWC